MHDISGRAWGERERKIPPAGEMSAKLTKGGRRLVIPSRSSISAKTETFSHVSVFASQAADPLSAA
jgi:hypothetical protein